MRLGLSVLAALALLAIGFIAGTLAADDGDEVDRLEDEAAEAVEERDETEAENGDLTERLDALRLDTREYTLRLDDVLLGFSREFTALGDEIQDAQTAPQFVRLIDRAESDISFSIESLNAINPPGEAQQIHDRILATFNDFSASLSDVAEATVDGSAEDLLEATADLEDSGLEFQRQLTTASKELRALGIELTDPADESTA